jgi:hypothetical protein
MRQHVHHRTYVRAQALSCSKHTCTRTYKRFALYTAHTGALHTRTSTLIYMQAYDMLDRFVNDKPF